MVTDSLGQPRRAKMPTGIAAWLQAAQDHAPTTSNLHSGELAFQRWYRFKEAFSPTFVRDVVASLPFSPRTCTDPFAGSGTTALTCQFLGIEPTTIEVNPFLADLAEAKLSTYDPDSLLKARSRVALHVRRAANSPRHDSRDAYFPGAPESFVEPGDGLRWIFSIEVAERIVAYRDAISALPDETHQRLLRILLASLLVPVSNVTISGKGRRYRRPSSLNRTTAADVDRLFEGSFQQALFDICRFGKRRCMSYSLMRGDARQRLSECNETDLILFSPPYPNSFDYTDIYNVELWALSYLDSSTSNRTLREETLRSHVQILRDFSTGTLRSRTLKRTIKTLEDRRELMWNRHIPEMVEAYADDMLRILEHAKSILRPNGRIVIVVGDSRYAGVKVDVAAIVAEIAASVGLSCKDKREVRAMRSSAQQGGQLSLGEWLLSFEHS